MSEEIHIEKTEKTPEEKLIDIERAKVALENDRIGLLKSLEELEKIRNENEIYKMKEGFTVLNLRVARLSGAVDEKSVEKARTQLYFLSQTNPNAPLTLDINSPGGHVSDGMELYGIIKELSRNGHHMTTRISGEACSMGGVIAQAGDTREIRRGSYLHLHEASWMAWGKASEMRESADFVEKVSKDISRIYAERSTMTASEIYDRFHRREWWLSAEEALEIKFVDAIV